MLSNVNRALSVCLPPEAVDEQSDGEGPEDSSHREDGDGHGPDGGEGGLVDGLPVPVCPGLVDEVLDHLRPTRHETRA